MKPLLYLKSGAIYKLKDILSEINPKKIFLVTGKNSYRSSNVNEPVNSILKKYSFTQYYDFDTNPNSKDVKKAFEYFKRENYDLIIAIGGGSVLDMAKIIKFSIINNLPFIDFKEKSTSEKYINIPLIAIPTTAGSGSEATQFAVLYINGVKHSIEDRHILPEIAIIDPNLTHSLPARLTAISGMDALCQAIESFWSVNSNNESKKYARDAIKFILTNIEKAVNQPSPEVRLAMSEASLLAGKAINISKTTAPHALSYYMTSKLGIPHGHAVSLTLGQFFIFNNDVSENDVADNRGVAYVRNNLNELFKCLDVENAPGAAALISTIMTNIGLQTKLTELVPEEEINLDAMIENINYERLTNNPRKITKQQCKRILNKIV